MRSPVTARNTLTRELWHPVFAWLAKHQTLPAALALVLVLHVCFFPFLWGDKTLLAASRGDVTSIMPNGAWYGGSQGPAFLRANDMGAASWVLEAFAPLIHHQYFAEKRLPFWNPYQAYGAPLAAAMQPQPFSPLYILFALHPGPRTFNFFVLGRLLLAGLFTYLYLRLFLPFSPSLAGGIAYMLCGYFILFYNMPHLSVEIFLPAVFLTTERLLRQPNIRNVLFSICAIFLCIVGGMPESTLLILTFGYVYFMFRLLSDGAARSAAGKHLRRFIFVNAIGFALAAFLLAPFLEYVRISFDMHQPHNVEGSITGIRHDPLGISIFTYVIPALFGPSNNPIVPRLGGQLRGYMGILPFLLAALAAGSVRHRRHFRNAAGRSVTAFFLLSSAALFLKQYGAPVVNWAGRLPLFQLVLFPKYGQPLLAFSVAALSAFGVDQALARSVSRRRLGASLLLAFALLAAALAFSWRAVAAAKADDLLFYWSLGGATAILFLAALVLLGPSDRHAQAPRWAATALIALLAAEMAGNYFYPVYYILSRSATDAANPYRGAPYLDYLRSRTGAGDRTFGRDGILYPNWAGGFQIADIRGLDAMYYRKYLKFVQAFLRADFPPDRRDLADRFTGWYTYDFDTALKRRLLQLSSVKYLLTLQPYAPDSQFVRAIFQQDRGRLTPGREKLIEARAFIIGGETKAVLYEHPIYERLPYKTEITPARRQFLFSVAMQPAVYDGSYPVCGAGVEFRLEVRDSSGRIAPLYSRYIDPKHNPAERRWISESVDLRKYMGQTVELLFTTTPGPSGDSCMDWAGWGDPHFNGDAGTPVLFRPVYVHEIKIYEYDDILPRAALFSQVELATDDDAALDRLVSPSFDVFQAAVVSPAGLSGADIAAVKAMDRLPHERARPARIVSYTSQEVTLDAATERPALLVLNDSDYPGWKVYVDGRRAHWITANYLFRGVLLGPGRHTVRFSYAPASFAIGAAITGAGLVCLAAFVWRRKRNGALREAAA